MSNFAINADSITKTFGRRLVFKNINFSFSKNGIYGISGSNGSGKTTLLKIAANLLSPTKGTIVYKNSDKIIPSADINNYVGFMAPYLVLYDEFSPMENFKHFAKIRGISFSKEKVENLLEELNLSTRKDESLKVYSSGMKQRVKFIFSLIHLPKLLLLDEPTSNLDEKGKNIVYDLIEKEKKDRITIIASNDIKELELCEQIINVEEYK
jgi:heme exporter protein A